MLRRALLPCVLLATGCNVLRAPQVSVKSVKVTQATGDALGVTLRLDVRNPNRAPVQIYDFRYALQVAGKDVYEGRRAGSATLGALGTRTVELPAVIPYDRLAWTPDGLPDIAGYELNGKLRYVAPNMLIQILFDAGVQRPGVDFASRGDLAIKAGTDSTPPAEATDQK